MTLSQRITSLADLNKLAITGLGVADHVVAEQSNNHPSSISTASHCVLREWRKGQENDRKVYEVLCDALQKVSFDAFINVPL